MYNQVITLISQTIGVDEYGDKVTLTAERTVFVDVRSIGMQEFYQAEATGLKPEIKFVLPDALDYRGEQELLFAPFCGVQQRYRVLRTYQAGTELEITAYREVNAT